MTSVETYPLECRKLQSVNINTENWAVTDGELWFNATYNRARGRNGGSTWLVMGYTPTVSNRQSLDRTRAEKLNL